MRAIDLITDEIPPLIHTDSGEKALNWMEEFKVSHLPVLKNGNFVGVVSESDILDHLNLDENLDKLFQHLPRPFVFGQAHMYDVIAKMAEYKLSVIPILDQQEHYLGCCSVYHVMTLLANTGSIKEHGGILVLEMNASDYSLAQISQIVESNNARILSVFMTSHQDSTNIDVTLKINSLDLTSIIRTFERYDYHVKASFQDGHGDEDMQWRYDTLMQYLKL
ncbi:MAG: CBS domain-containing protein [Crocinitomicaceae bacterium]|jgi:acetoin utilization protein AcuB|nr:CBS domain-containing protein [Crocinitomicaceae bacterium]MDP4760868.1 CBS domain-containing protein [Crocinitomicaceae bacterium]